MIWDKIGIVGEQRTARRGVVLMHMGNLLDEMVREEDSLRSRLVENIDKYRADLARLSKELDLPHHEVKIKVKSSLHTSTKSLVHFV